MVRPYIQKIHRKTLHVELDYTQPIWKTISKEAQKCVSGNKFNNILRNAGQKPKKAHDIEGSSCSSMAYSRGGTI